MAESFDPQNPHAGDASPVSEAEAVDRRVHDLLQLVYDGGPVEIFGEAAADRLAIDKKAADRLVQLRLAFYPDESRDRLHITNSGRYWALNGGYMAFLKEDPPTGGGGTRGRNPEMEALRFTYMKLRLNTFWLTFGLSIASFFISIVSLGIAYYFREALLN